MVAALERHAATLHSNGLYSIKDSGQLCVTGRCGWSVVHLATAQHKVFAIPPLTPYSCHPLAATFAEISQEDNNSNGGMGLHIRSRSFHTPALGFLLFMLHYKTRGCYCHLRGKGSCIESDNAQFNSPVSTSYLPSLDAVMLPLFFISTRKRLQPPNSPKIPRVPAYTRAVLQKKILLNQSLMAISLIHTSVIGKQPDVGIPHQDNTDYLGLSMG
jgi:hypothetical protein